MLAKFYYSRENKAFLERLMKIKNLPVGRAKKSSGWSPGMARDDSNIPVIDCYNVRYRPEYHYMMKNKRAAREMAAKQIRNENKEIYHRVRVRESDYAPQKNYTCVMPRTFVGTKKQKPLGNPLLPHLDYKPLKQLRDEPSYEISPVSTIPPSRKSNNLPSLNNTTNNYNNSYSSSTQQQRSPQRTPSPSSDKSSRPTTTQSKQNPKNSRPDVDPSLTPKSLYCGGYRIDGIDYYVNIYELCSNKGKYYFMESIYFQVYDEVSDISSCIELSIPEFILSLQSNPALFNKITSYWKKFEKIAPYIKPSISFVLDPGDLYGLCVCICDCIDVSIINDEMVLTFVEYDENDYSNNNNNRNGNENDVEYIDILESSDYMSRASQTMEQLENENYYNNEDSLENGEEPKEEEVKKEEENKVEEEKQQHEEEVNTEEEENKQNEVEEEKQQQEEEVNNKEEESKDENNNQMDDEVTQKDKEEVKEEEKEEVKEEEEEEINDKEDEENNEEVKVEKEEGDNQQQIENEEIKKEEINEIINENGNEEENKVEEGKEEENEELTSAELLDLKPQPDNEEKENSFDDFE